jgi:hypothetical protein
MDRWLAAKRGCSQLSYSIHAAQIDKQLERQQHPAHCGAQRKAPMQDAGTKALAKRKAERSRIYAYENDDLAMTT